MATYKIAPVSTGPIGMAQMKYGLVNKADYNHANGVTTTISMDTLVVSPTTYQGDLTSKTWNTSQPHGFSEMYNQTWEDVILATVSYSFIAPSGGTIGATIYKINTTTPNVLFNQSGMTGTNNGTVTVTSGDKVIVAVQTYHPSDPYSVTGTYRVPNSGTYTSWFFQSSGPSGGTLTNQVNFFVTSPNTTAGFIVNAS